MKIELKKIKHFPTLSEETNAFTADLHIDGKNICQVKNDGHGGCTNIQAYGKERDIVDKADAFCKTLPPIVYGDMSIPMNLEHFVDDLLEKNLLSKEVERIIKKLDKAASKCIIVIKKEIIDLLVSGKLPQGQIGWREFTGTPSPDKISKEEIIYTPRKA